MFYNTDIGFYLFVVYKNDFGEEVKGDMELVYKCKCDIQPYSSERLEKDYGVTEEVTHKIYCDLVGMDYDYVRVAEQMFIVKSNIVWDSYQILMVQKCQL